MWPSWRDLLARPSDAETLGGLLHSFLFPPPIQDLYNRSLALMRNQAGLRVRLRIQADQPELSLIPWEYCWGGKTFLALDANTPLVRYMPTDEPIQPLMHPWPVRVLVATADTTGTLNLSAELHHIQTALQSLQAKGQVVLQVLENVTRQALSEVVQGHSPHIFHFIGHGDLVGEGEGVLLLVGENGRSDPVTAKDLMVLLQGSVKLAILNACRTAEVVADKPLLAVAHRLVWAGLPAAIGMQFRMPDKTAESFSRVLYQRLIDGQPLDTAVTQARIALYFNQQDKVFWAIPVLFMRTDDGRLWETAGLPASSSLNLITDIDFSPPTPADEQAGAKRSWFIRLRIENNGRAGATNCFGQLLKVLNEKMEHLKQFDALDFYWTRQDKPENCQKLNIRETEVSTISI